MTENPDRINDPEIQLDETINKLADQYASCDRRSAEINEERASIRDNAEKLGIPAKAFVHAVAQVKQMSDGEMRDYQVGVNRVLKVIGGRQNDLFPESAERIKKREDRKSEKAAKEGRTDAELDAASESNPRSDPNAGGAKPQTTPTEDELTAAAANAAAEQEDGEEILKAAKPKAQSTKAAEKRAAAGLN